MLTISLHVFNVGREVSTAGQAIITKEQAGEVVPIIINFINSCSVEQIRAIPDKCIYISLLL